jgi:di/tricarboxylate transporter
LELSDGPERCRWAIWEASFVFISSSWPASPWRAGGCEWTWSAFLVVLALDLIGILGPKKALADFSVPVVLTIASLLIVGEALARTGFAITVGSWVIRRAGSNCDVRVFGFERTERFVARVIGAPSAGFAVREGDVLFLQAHGTEFVRRIEDLELKVQSVQERHSESMVRDVGVAEVLIPPESSLKGKSLRESKFRLRYQLEAIAASSAYISPISSPVGTLVIRLGGYRCMDVVRAGFPPFALTWIVAMAIIGLLFSFSRILLQLPKESRPRVHFGQ